MIQVLQRQRFMSRQLQKIITSPIILLNVIVFNSRNGKRKFVGNNEANGNTLLYDIGKSDNDILESEDSVLRWIAIPLMMLLWDIIEFAMLCSRMMSGAIRLMEHMYISDKMNNNKVLQVTMMVTILHSVMSTFFNGFNFVICPM